MKVESVTPVIDVSFWQRAYYLKLESLKLSEDPMKIFGFTKCSKFNDGKLLMNLEGRSFDVEEAKLTPNSYHQVNLPGLIQIINTENKFDDFCLKAESTFAEYMKNRIDEPVAFFMVLFINHKTFDFTYTIYQTRRLKSYSKCLKSEANVEEYQFKIDAELAKSSGGLILGAKDGHPIICDTTGDKAISSFAIDTVLLQKGIGFYATRNPIVIKDDDQPTTATLKRFHLVDVSKESESFGLFLKQVQRQEKLSLKPFLSKEQLVEDQSLLNLKLMKWRLEPLLDLQMLFNQKALILGSGTLGCNIGRLLVGYGVRKITFLDYGSVSFSNLARQSLFTIKSFVSEGKGLPKADAAKIGLQLIAPHLEVDSVSMTVPMPGHFVTDERLDSVYSDLIKLEELVKGHDIVFNVFDSREARYFPSLIGALFNKTVISIGLGYDSYVIVHHGNYGLDTCTELLTSSPESESKSIEGVNPQNPESKYGCFFCSDYLPPSDSMSNRTMDQQCTVSRPGISMVASGVAMELLINNLHRGKIGKCSHFVRGSAGIGFELVEYENSRFDNCVACSRNVITEYLKDKKLFLQNVLNNPNIIGKYTGFEVDTETGVTIGEDFEDDDGIIVIDLMTKFGNESEPAMTIPKD